MPETYGSAPPANPFGSQRVLWQLIGANMNSTADQAFTQVFPFSVSNIRGVSVMQASGSLSGAVGGIYLAASKTTPIVAAAQTYVGITGVNSILDLTLNAAGGQLVNSATVFLSLTTGLGSAGTSNIYIWGFAIS